MISKVCLCAQVDIAQLYKASDGLLSQNGVSQVEIRAHKAYGQAMTWIIDEAETEESAAEVCHLNAVTIWLCYKHFKVKSRNAVANGCAMSISKAN